MNQTKYEKKIFTDIRKIIERKLNFRHILFKIPIGVSTTLLNN